MCICTWLCAYECLSKRKALNLPGSRTAGGWELSFIVQGTSSEDAFHFWTLSPTSSSLLLHTFICFFLRNTKASLRNAFEADVLTARHSSFLFLRECPGHLRSQRIFHSWNSWAFFSQMTIHCPLLPCSQSNNF